MNFQTAHATLTPALTMVGTRHECQCCGRIARITGEYDDDGTGYEYEFEGEPGKRWISTHAASIRFKKIGDDSVAVKAALVASVTSGRAPMKPQIAKGTTVLVKTTNGGELVADLYEGYRPTYDAVLMHHGQPIVIPAFRLKSIETLQPAGE